MAALSQTRSEARLESRPPINPQHPPCSPEAVKNSQERLQEPFLAISCAMALVRPIAYLPYSTLGNHRPISGQMYSITSATTWMPMKGIIPMKMALSVTCGGATPLR